MKAIVCKKFAAVSELVWEEVESPVAGPGEIVVDIKAAGLNYPDNLIVQGLYQFQPERPFSPGHEGSGVVSSVGKGVDFHSTGDRVAFFKGFGAFAEKVVVPAKINLCSKKDTDFGKPFVLVNVPNDQSAVPPVPLKLSVVVAVTCVAEEKFVILA